MERSMINVLQCFNLVVPVISAIPDPISGPICSVLQQILDAVQKARDNKNQLKVLFSRVCDILMSLRVPQNFADETLQRSVETLISNLESIRDFAISLRTKNIFKAMLQSSDIKLSIEELERNLWSSCLAFQNSALIRANQKLDDLWNLANDHNRNRISAEQLQAARLEDQREQLKMIHDAVSSLSSGTDMLDTILETINVDSTLSVTAMTALLERNDTGRIKLRDPEIKFLRAGIARLNEQRSAHAIVHIKSWTVTGWEVERGFLLGSDRTSFIRAGRWLGNSAGIIEFKDVETTVRYVKAWKNLRSTCIQSFLGASTVDNPPFILIQPSHLNIAEYVKTSAKSNYRRLVLNVIRALEYLHTRTPPVFHGALRPATIDVDSKGSVVVGSVGLRLDDVRISSQDERLELERMLHQWTAPELLEDSDIAPNAESDIFSLGAVLSELINLIRERNPNRKLPILTSIAKHCTEHEPSARPTLSDLVKRLEEPNSRDHVTDLLALMPSVDNITELTGLQNVDRWRVVPYVCKMERIFTQYDDDAYLSSAPLEGLNEHPLRQLCIEIRCHDQGQEWTTAHPRDGAWAWVELALLREGMEGKRDQVDLNVALRGQPRGFMVEDTRYEIIRLPFADSTQRVHRINLDWRNPLLKEARRGDIIALHPKARFPGWLNCIYSAEMHVVTEH